MYRVLGLVSSFCRRSGCGLITVFAIWLGLTFGAISNLKKEARGRLASPPPVEVKLSEISLMHDNHDVLVSGIVDSNAALESGDYYQFYPLSDGKTWIPVRFSSEPTIPNGALKLKGRVSIVDQSSTEALEESSDTIDGTKVRDDLYLRVGFDEQHGGLPVWLNWVILVLTAIGIPLILISLAKRNVIFVEETVEPQVESATEVDEFDYIGPLHFAQDRKVLFRVPARLFDHQNGTRSMVSSIRVPLFSVGFFTSYQQGDWTLTFAPDSVNQVQSGWLYDGWKIWPALRFEVLDLGSQTRTKVCLTFSSLAQRQACRETLEKP